MGLLSQISVAPVLEVSKGGEVYILSRYKRKKVIDSRLAESLDDVGTTSRRNPLNRSLNPGVE